MIVCILITHDLETEKRFVGSGVEQNKQLVYVKQNIKFRWDGHISVNSL